MKRWFPSVLLVIVAGCARFQPSPLSPADTAAALDQRSLTNLPLRSFFETNLHLAIPEWPVPQWDLDSLTAAAFYYHPSLAVARAQYSVEQGGQVTAAQLPNPTLNVTPGYNVTTTVPSPWIPFGTLDWTVETAGKRRYRRDRAAQLAESARLNVISVAWQIRNSLHLSLLDWASAHQHAENFRRQTGLLQETVDRLEQRVRAGAISASETLSLRISLAHARSDLAEAQRQRAEARARIAEAVGVPVHALDDIVISVPLTPPGQNSELTSADARRAALLGRADILAALADYAAAEAALHLEIARQYPDIHLQPGYQYDQGDSKWSLGLTLELPVLNQNQGPIAEASARRIESAARFNALQAKVLADIDRSILILRVAETNVMTLNALAVSQAERVRSVAAQFQAGAADRLDVLNAELEAAATEALRTDGQVRLQQAVAALEDAVQRPLTLVAALAQTSPTHATGTAQR